VHKIRVIVAIQIGSSVGSGCANNKADVTKIQIALNTFPVGWGGPSPKLPVNGTSSAALIAAIENLQSWQYGWKDGKISPGGVTLQRINSMIASPERPGNPDAISIKWEVSFPFVGQVLSMGCWAATAAMMLCVRDHKQYQLEEILTKADGGPAGTFRLAFLMDGGLKWELHDKFTKALGLKREGLKSFPISTFASWLKYNPLGLTLVFSNKSHIVCLHGMKGDGTEYGTYGFGYDPMGKNFIYSWRTLRGQFELVDLKSIWRC